MYLLWLLSFSLSAGPVGWIIPAEVSSTRLRSQAVFLARDSYYLAQIVGSVTEPYMMNPTAWNWNGKTGILPLLVGDCFSHALVGWIPDARCEGQNLPAAGYHVREGVANLKLKNFKVDAYMEGVALEERAQEE